MSQFTLTHKNTRIHKKQIKKDEEISSDIFFYRKTQTTLLYILRKNSKKINQASHMHRQGLSFCKTNRYQPSDTSAIKQQHSSLHTKKKLNKTQYPAYGSLSPVENLPILRTKNRSIPVYLLYKNEKLVVKCQIGLEYTVLVQRLYRQIIKYQYTKNCFKSQEQAQCCLKNILGFSTACNNVKIDYLLSILEGTVDRSLLLNCFMKKNKQKTKDRSLKYSTNRSFCKNTTGSYHKFEYEIYSCLAIGGFSKVYLARSYQNGKFYALKFIRKKKQNYQFNRASVLNQMQINSALDHPFLIKMKEGFETNRFYCMVFQYCPGGELFYLLKRIKMMSQDHARFYFIQILLGIQHIHEKNVLYRDLKPENILIDRKGCVKIVDFGLSKKVCSNRDKTYSYCGSAQYMAPEMILRTGHNTSIDYYSLGALLYELVTGLPPFYSKCQQQLQKSIITKQLAFPAHVPLSFQIKDLLTHLLAKDLKYRLGSYSGIKQIMFHPWVGKFNTTEVLNNSGQKIPYPPDLSKHNFDMDELGDDEQQFTLEVYKDIFGKSTNSQSRYHIRSTKTEERQIYADIIDKIVEETYQQYKENQQNLAEVKKSTEKIQPCNYYRQAIMKSFRNSAKILHNHNHQYSIEKQNSMSILTKNTENFIRNISKLQSPLKNQKKPEHPQKQSLKLLPYFCKTKIQRPEKHKMLPRANILRLKITENHTIRQELQQKQLN